MALPANIYHVVTWWSGLGKSGGDTYYVARAASTPNAVGVLLTPLWQKRAQLLSRAYALIGARVSTWTDATGARVRRRSKPYEFFYPGTQTVTGDPTKPLLSEFKTADLLVQYEDTLGRIKPWYCAGIPTEIVAGEGTYIATPTWNSVWPGYVQLAFAAGVGWLTQTLSDKVDITGWTQNVTTGKVSIDIGAPITVDDPTRPFEVDIKVPGEKTPLDGRKAVQYPIIAGVRDLSTLVTLESIGVRPFTAGTTATVQTWSTQFTSVANDSQGNNLGTITPIRAVSHKRGNASPSGRGRRPTPARW